MTDATTPPRYWECGNCGHTLYDDDGWESWHCSACGEEMHETAPPGYVPKDDLRELVDEWNEAAEWAYADGKPREGDAVGMCADELEAVLEDE